jgi:hypothetical protein
MSRISHHHAPGCGVEGKCSRPMFGAYAPAGFCDCPAWGEQYTRGSKHAPYYDAPGTPGIHGNYQPYVPAFACDWHGGPSFNGIRFVRDGNMWCAFRSDFENLQESAAGFGETQALAEADLCACELAAAA